MESSVRHFRHRPTRLEPDQGCANRAHWRCSLPLELAVEGLEAVLESGGWTARCRHEALRLWRHPEGHELVWVVPTGRVQIRVDIAVPSRSRRLVAHQLHRELGVATRRVSS